MTLKLIEETNRAAAAIMGEAVVKPKEFKIVAEQDEVVHRTNKADLVFRVTVDAAKLRAKAQEAFASDMKDWERSGKEDGEPEPLLANSLKSIEEDAADELSKVTASDLGARRDGDLRFPKYWYLKAEVLFNGKPIAGLYDAEFEYKGGEVSPVQDSEYSLKF